MNGYDPHAHALDLGVRVVHRPLGKLTGLWVPRHGAIFLRPGMTRRHERSVLAHEVAHVELGHVLSTRRTEAAADARAARLLIDPAELAAQMRWSQEVAELAIELGVSERILLAYLRAHPPA
ncbi:ImmA/IrrE family metallo-endopeptidase [Mycetocola spongiae]|uniref:ImmA/IrrE family metallo-endopeptidase n=1 Tax=Mycetocola spongiae TaxID=2859226 RepID=UPI001CF23B2F|nr:ImmA/IrrE family metallo-endopeptidase [Mycetocola spongiae]UCR88319.1 ImmA/IrrE family metallo-endopeptidase [Mycetocola spongiae]